MLAIQPCQRKNLDSFILNEKGKVHNFRRQKDNLLRFAKMYSTDRYVSEMAEDKDQCASFALAPPTAEAPATRNDPYCFRRETALHLYMHLGGGWGGELSWIWDTVLGVHWGLGTYPS